MCDLKESVLTSVNLQNLNQIEKALLNRLYRYKL